ncbi:MAG: flagellar hook-length control protein FliK [Phycisphaerales bacterium]|nr:flagellar hook-length control protein FliK [Phycisphaerales bacterium]
MKSGTGAVTLRLNPDSLGQLRIRIQLPSEGGRDPQVSARFEAESEAARQLIERSFPHLRESLAQRGLDVGRLEVADVPPIRGQRRSAEQSASQLGPPHVGTPSAEEPTDPVSSAQVSPDGGGTAHGGDHEAGSEAESWSGMAARTWQGGPGATEDQPSEDLTRSVELWGWERSGRSAAIYQLTKSTDGGAARIVIDAIG